MVPSRAVKDRQQFERMLRVVIALASLGMLAIVLFPPFYATPDEAKYIGLGLNLLDGRGLVTVFGVAFPNHSPIWPLVDGAPAALAGRSTGSPPGTCSTRSPPRSSSRSRARWAGAIRPAAGALAAVVMLAFPFLASNARTAGLDLPATALTLGFLVVALRAIDRGSTPLALASGVLFGLGFLVKETALPFFPVPFLVALLAGTASCASPGSGAAAVATAAVTVSWWFVMHAGMEGTVYRLGTPAWTLVPLTVGARGRRRRGLERTLVRIAHVRVARWDPRVTVAREQLARDRRLGRPRGVVARAAVRLRADGEARRAVAVPGIAVDLGPPGLPSPPLARRRVRHRRDTLRPSLLVRRSQGVRELVFATIAGIPLVLLVLAIGEAPRHYLANIAVLVALAARAGCVGSTRRGSTAAGPSRSAVFDRRRPRPRAADAGHAGPGRDRGLGRARHWRRLAHIPGRDTGRGRRPGDAPRSWLDPVRVRGRREAAWRSSARASRPSTTSRRGSTTTVPAGETVVLSPLLGL